MLAVGGHLLAPLHYRCVQMSTPFGGGIGGSWEELCGAFSASLMIIGGLYARASPSEGTERTDALAQELRRRFAKRWGTLTCGPIREYAKGPTGPTGSCNFVVAESVRLLLDLLRELAPDIERRLIRIEA